MVHRWKTITADDRGDPNTVFSKATIPDPNSYDPGRRIIVGFALWIQSATLPEYGIVHSSELRDAMDLDALLPGNKSEQEFLCQMYRCQARPRLEFLKAKTASSTEPPVILVLCTCATHPSYQRRGIGTKLTQWGLDEARRQGISDVTVEGSRMGRRLYERLGFRPQGQSILYEVDDKFSNREKPSNVFMIYSSETSLSRSPRGGSLTDGLYLHGGVLGKGNKQT
ncbi:hypothetical protein F5Y07DRAFT_26379 [Xylaria sp. FL0933]|nr:hypothetical protein F5Y07DRAFT_26379 [Xylaria sp. FL0933]